MSTDLATTDEIPRTIPEVLHALRKMLNRQTRRRLTWAVGASTVLAGIEVLGLILMVPLLTVISGGDLATTGPAGKIVDILGGGDREHVVVVLAVAVFFVFAARAVLTLVLRWWMLGVIYRDEARVISLLLRRYLTAPYQFHLRTNSAVLLRTMTESVRRAYQAVVVSVACTVSEGIIVVAIAGALLIIHPLIALGMVAYFGVAGFALTRVATKRIRPIGMQMSDSYAEVLQRATEPIGAIKHVLLGAHQDVFVERFGDAQYRSSMLQRKVLFLMEFPRQFLELVFVIGIGLMIIAVTITDGSSELVAAVGLFAVAGFRLLPNVVRIARYMQEIHGGMASVGLVVQDLEIAPSPPDRLSVDSTRLFERELEISNVTFQYTETTGPALTQVDLTVYPGESIALVGPSGAGKTTLIDLIVGLHPPTGGVIKVDGIDIGDIRNAWQRLVALVPQDVYLLDGTVIENIAFGDDPATIDMQRITSAVRSAALDEVIDGLPNGLHTIVGERGVLLSGGQRQRIGVARALYREAKLLILDEATSALDTITERRITETVKSLRGHLTTITIAHRLSTIESVDRVVVIEDGCVTATGTYSELDSGNGYLRRAANQSPYDLIPEDAQVIVHSGTGSGAFD